MALSCLLLAANDKNALATHYRQSQLHQNVMEELEDVTQSIAGVATSEEQAPAYVTSFLYQVNKPVHLNISWAEVHISFVYNSEGNENLS